MSPTPAAPAVLTEEIATRLRRPVGRPVSFKYPGDEGAREGILKDRLILPGGFGPAKAGRPGVPYYHVLDLIRFDGEPEDFLRLSYYRHLPDGRLIFGGQFAACSPLSQWAGLLAALHDTGWVPPSPR